MENEVTTQNGKGLTASQGSMDPSIRSIVHFELRKVRKKRPPRYGIDRVLYQIEGMFLSQRAYFGGGMYQVWINLSNSQKIKVRERLLRVIRRELLGKDFRRALLEDIVEESGKIRVESALYRYLRSRLFKGNSIKMLRYLRDEEEELEDE